MGVGSAEIAQRAGKVRLIVLDVDGVLTDGRIHLSSGGQEGRSFYVRDGLGIRLGQRGGLTFGIISGRESTVVTERAAELGITEVRQGILDKAACLDEMTTRVGVQHDAVCFVGDDLIDVPAMRRVGLAVAPHDAAPECRAAAHHVTESAGGRGAVREIVDLVLRATGRWDDVAGPFLVENA